MPLDLHREWLAVKALDRPYFHPSSPLRSLLDSEDVANSSWKFAVLVHPRFLDAIIVYFNVLELILEGAPP